VHRLWSPVRQRHFYTIHSSEKDAILAQSPNDAWTYEGIAFYAFAHGRQPSDAVPVHRFRGEQKEYSWAVTAPENIGTVPNKVLGVADSDMVDEGVTWYVHVAGEPPAGMSIQDGTLRWRPGPGQRGEHQINIVVSDGNMESCQLVKIRVVGPEVASSNPLVVTPSGVPSYALTGTLRTGSSALTLPSTNPQSGYAGLGRLPAAADRLFDGFTESLMVFFLVPWGLGLYHRTRYEAERLERVLMTAVIVVNVGLIFARYVWVAPTMERRYCLPLIALTIFYVPVGLERIALWLSRRAATADKSQELLSKHNSTWFHILAIIGIGICLPKLLTPLYVEKESYRKTIQWLRDNTRPEDVTAVPDSRLTFYAQRPGLLYRNEVDPRRADYIVRILDKDAKAAPPSGWSQEYSVPINDRRGRTLVIYKTHRQKS
jgi:hypothetical protein